MMYCATAQPSDHLLVNTPIAKLWESTVARHVTLNSSAPKPNFTPDVVGHLFINQPPAMQSRLLKIDL
jgi:hypothetical protein